VKSELTEINRKLDVLLRLTALGILRDKDSYRAQVETLNTAGFSPKEIAALTRKTINNVNVTLHLIRKTNKG